MRSRGLRQTVLLAILLASAGTTATSSLRQVRQGPRSLAEERPGPDDESRTSSASIVGNAWGVRAPAIPTAEHASRLIVSSRHTPRFIAHTASSASDPFECMSPDVGRATRVERRARGDGGHLK